VAFLRGLGYYCDVDHQTRKQPVLVIIRGIPGSGKSYLSLRLQAALGGSKDVEVLDPDAINQQSADYQELVAKLRSDTVDEKLYPYRYLRAKAYDAIEAGKILIWNQPFISFDGITKTIERLMTHAKENGKDLSVIVVEVELNKDLARARVADRKQQGGHGPSEGTLERFMRDYKSFAGNGYKTITVDGASDVSRSTEMILAAVQDS
tara:strand:- start:6009 stop:6629 length:621 start_codon:yes stop_codon:yes gene_type:complete